MSTGKKQSDVEREPVADGQTERHREFSYSARDFARIKELVKRHTGIALSDAKQDMVYSRLARRLRQLRLSSFREYCDLVEDGSHEEFTQFINSITTNLTSFFREMHHFKFLSETALPQLMGGRRDSRRLRIWSAGCSTGEEPYSIGMVAKETVPSGWDLKILATDLDSNVLRTAQAGCYPADRAKGLGKDQLHKWFTSIGGRSEGGQLQVVPELQELVAFKQLNLMDAWPMRGPFDIIFCRNVVIYFDKETQKRLFDRFVDLLADDGYLFVGHSESLYKVTDRVTLIGNTIYRKRE